jgi:hypothetical protein
MILPPVQHKRYDDPSAFTAQSPLRQARRQKGLRLAAGSDVTNADKANVCTSG